MGTQRDEAFEEAYSNICKPIIARPYPRNENGEYFYKEIHEAHLMWQAAKASVVEWISIQDKWPERGDPVLLIVNGVVQQVTYFRSYLNADDDWFEPVYFEGDCLPIHDVTHWQQLPELPKAREPSND